MPMIRNMGQALRQAVTDYGPDKEHEVTVKIKPLPPEQRASGMIPKKDAPVDMETFNAPRRGGQQMQPPIDLASAAAERTDMGMMDPSLGLEGGLGMMPGMEQGMDPVVANAIRALALLRLRTQQQV